MHLSRSQLKDKHENELELMRVERRRDSDQVLHLKEECALLKGEKNEGVQLENKEAQETYDLAERVKKLEGKLDDWGKRFNEQEKNVSAKTERINEMEKTIGEKNYVLSEQADMIVALYEKVTEKDLIVKETLEIVEQVKTLFTERDTAFRNLKEDNVNLSKELAEVQKELFALKGEQSKPMEDVPVKEGEDVLVNQSDTDVKETDGSLLKTVNVVLNASNVKKDVEARLPSEEVTKAQSATVTGYRSESNDVYSLERAQELVIEIEQVRNEFNEELKLKEEQQLEMNNEIKEKKGRVIAATVSLDKQTEGCEDQIKKLESELEDLKIEYEEELQAEIEANQSEMEETKRDMLTATQVSNLGKYIKKECHKMKKGSRSVIEEGEVVILKEAGRPRSQWRLGKVSKLLTAKDGQTRGVEVQVVDNKGKMMTLKRAIELLHPLEIREEKEDVEEEIVDSARNGDQEEGVKLKEVKVQQEVVTRKRPRRTAAIDADWRRRLLEDQ